MASGYAQNTNVLAIRGDSLDWGMLTSNNASSNITALRNGAAINLTGGAVKLTAKYAYDDADVAAVFVKSIGSGITFVDAATGVFTITVAPGDTSPLSPIINNLVFDLQCTTSGGVVTTIQSGILTVNPDATITTP